MNKLLLLGLAGLGLWYVKRPNAAALPLPPAPGETVTKNGHTWELVTLPRNDGAVGATIVNVFAPAGSWGPHARLLVLQFSAVMGAGVTYRTLTAVGSDVPVAMRDAAMKDLDVKPPGA